MKLKLITGHEDYPLYQEIKEHLQYSTQESCSIPCTSIKFSNENIKVKIEECIRGDDIFVIQPCYPSLNERILELLILIDALKYASAKRISVVLPYFPYVRSDKKDESRISITARLMADLISTAGADRVLAMNLHSAQIQGFFRVPMDHLLPGRTIAKYLSNGRIPEKTVFVAPDTGSARMVGYFSEKLNKPFVVIEKRRVDDTENPKIINVIGEVKGYHCIILDDEIASGGTVLKAAEKLTELGATGVDVCAVHGVFTDKSHEIFNGSEYINKIYVTNSIYRPDIVYPDNTKIISVAEMLSQAILCTHKDNSITTVCDRYQI
jgi:ribose-phosphate pyrophosphokinase